MPLCTYLLPYHTERCWLPSCNVECLFQSGGIQVDGRKLIIVAAVTKEDATKLNDKKKKVETGTRNLYLAREGCE